MQGGMAQTIGLVLAANAAKRGLPIARWPDSSIYTFCNEVRFVGRKSNSISGTGRSFDIDDPNLWLNTLPAGMDKAQLNILPQNDQRISDRESVGFANGGPIFLAQIIASEVESWCGDWQVTGDGSKGGRIWSVTYRNVPGIPTDVHVRSKDDVRNKLKQVLNDANQFSRDHGMAFVASFERALKSLDDDAPSAGSNLADVLPDGIMTLEHLQIFSCAAKAWVFGGMGSWNDAWFEGGDQHVYQSLSDSLFSAIIEGLVLSTNSSAAD